MGRRSSVAKDIKLVKVMGKEMTPEHYKQTIDLIARLLVRHYLEKKAAEKAGSASPPPNIP